MKKLIFKHKYTGKRVYLSSTQGYPTGVFKKTQIDGNIQLS